MDGWALLHYALLLHEMFIQPWIVTKMMSAGEKITIFKTTSSNHSRFGKASDTFGGNV